MTGPTPAEAIVGWDVEWLARDADDHVAVFATGGGGYAPPEFLRDTDAHQTAIGALMELPASTSAEFAPEVPSGYTNSWLMAAERGLFAFDSDDEGGPYHLQAAPRVPALAAELPATVNAVVSELRYPDLRFASRPTISAESLLRPPFEDLPFAYLAWLRDWTRPSDDPNHERVAQFVVIAYTQERAKEWGDEVVRRTLMRHRDVELSRSAATVAHGRSDPRLPNVRYGEDAPDDVVGW